MSDSNCWSCCNLALTSPSSYRKIVVNMRYITAIILPLLLLQVKAADFIEVGTYPAKVTPEQIAIIPVSEKGVVTQIADDSKRMKKGDIIAKVNEEQLKEERHDLDLQILSDKISRKDSMRALLKQKRQLQFYFSLSERERRYATDIQVHGELPTRQAIDDIDERIKLAEMEMERKPQRMEKEFNKKVELNTLTMPFDGRFQYQVVLPEDRSQPYETKPVPHFATAIDDSSYYITMPVTQAALTQLPTDKFIVRIDLPAGKQLNGVFSHRRLEKAGASEAFVYYFRVPEGAKDRAYSLMGSTAQARLFYQLSDQLKRVDLNHHYGGEAAESSSSKEEFIRKTFPGYNILLETDTELILIPEGVEP